MALREIDDFKRTVNRQLNTLKDAVDGDIDTKLALFTRDINNAKRKEDNPNNGFQKTLELMLDLETKLTQRQASFQTEIKASIHKIATKVDSATRAMTDADHRLGDLELQI